LLPPRPTSPPFPYTTLFRSREAPQVAPELWFTYHLYHKAPDWLGPQIADALRIPYVVAEASDAPKQASRGWAAGRRAAERAIRRSEEHTLNSSHVAISYAVF